MGRLHRVRRCVDRRRRHSLLVVVSLLTTACSSANSSSETLLSTPVEVAVSRVPATATDRSAPAATTTPPTAPTAPTTPPTGPTAPTTARTGPTAPTTAPTTARTGKTTTPSIAAAVPTASPPPPATTVGVSTCTSQAVADETGITLVNEPVCHDGWANGVTVEQSRSTGAADFSTFFQIVDGKWFSVGALYLHSCDPFETVGMPDATAVAFGVTSCADLTIGSTGDAVTRLQNDLTNAGFAVTADGIYGRRTAAAVAAFQARRGLPATGIAGPSTRAALGEPT